MEYPVAIEKPTHPTPAQKIERVLAHIRECELLPDTQDLRTAIDCDRNYREFCYLLIYEALVPKLNCLRSVARDFVEETLVSVLDITEACAAQMREIPAFDEVPPDLHDDEDGEE